MEKGSGRGQREGARRTDGVQGGGTGRGHREGARERAGRGSALFGLSPTTQSTGEQQANLDLLPLCNVM